MDNKIELISRKAVLDALFAYDNGLDENSDGYHTVFEQGALANAIQIVQKAETLAVLPIREVSQ